MTESKTIKLLLVDDHPIVRDGLAKLDQIDPQLRIVGAVGSVTEAIVLARKSTPDVVLLDLRLPDGSGIEACRRIKADSPKTRVLFLTSFADNDVVLSAMEAGADGYLLKESDAKKIIDAIRTVMKGGAVFDPIVTKSVMKNARLSANASLLAELTGQEKRVLAEVATGKTDKEVAHILGLSSKTVRNYLDRVFEKLHVNTRTQAAMIFLRHSSFN